MFDAESYVDSLLKTKPGNIANNDYLNGLYAKINGT